MNRVKDKRFIDITFPDDEKIYQSTQQAFYFIEEISIQGETITKEDWVLAYHENTLVGARQWNGEFTDIPTMGNDNLLETDGYCENGSELRFKIRQESSGKYFQIVESIPKWQSNGIFLMSKLSAREMPSEFMISSAYPNPFNPTTNISFGIAQDSYVQVKIYNISGREIETLASGNYISGYHSLTWNADKHSSGLYFLSILSDGIYNTQKLILLK